MIIESRTPRYLKDCKTASELNNLGDFLEFGFMQRTKWQSQEYNSSIKVLIEFKNLLPKNFFAAFFAAFWFCYEFYFNSSPTQIFKIDSDFVFCKIAISCCGN